MLLLQASGTHSNINYAPHITSS